MIYPQAASLIVYLLKFHHFTAKELIDTIKKYRITYTDQHIIRLFESKKSDELDVEFEGIAHPKMDLVVYEDLKNYLLEHCKNIITV